MCISCFIYFANELLFTVYFIFKINKNMFILDYGNDVRHKANLSNFLIRFQNGKAAETTCNTNNAFGPGTAN